MAFSREQALAYLKDANSHGRLAHAFLFSGPDGSGKRRLVGDFFSAINVEKADKADFHEIAPESKSRKILVEQIRVLESSLRMRATRAKTKFGVIYEADRLMPQAANAFLKTLEEPPDHSVLILVSSLPEALLDTIRSRCIEVQLRPVGIQKLTVEEEALLAELRGIVEAEGFSIVTALRMARAFRDALEKVRDRIETEHGDLLTKDKTAYQQTTDGAWLEEREERLTALTESRYLKARGNLVLRLIEWFGDALRVKHESPYLDLVDYREAVTTLAGKLSTAELLKRLGALQSLLEALSKNVHEAVAVEVAFLAAFGPMAQKPEGGLAQAASLDKKEDLVMQIYLLRHAEAESDSARDEARALTAKGSKQAESIGRFCLKHGFIPGVILSSPLTRAEETARLVALQLNLPKLVQVEEFLRAGMTPERALSGLREVFINLTKRQKCSENASMMLVGHEPDLSNLAGLLIGGRARSVHFRKATLMDLTVEELKQGAGTIEFLLPVKYL